MKYKVGQVLVYIGKTPNVHHIYRGQKFTISEVGITIYIIEEDNWHWDSNYIEDKECFRPAEIDWQKELE